MERITSNQVVGLMEAYNAVYTPQINEEQVWEEVETWVNSLLEEGYDLSEYTWEEMYESYIEQLNEAQPMTAFQAAGGNAQLAKLNKGRSPRSGRATASTIERQGQQNLYKAGGGDAAIAKGPTTTRNVRGGGTQQVPTLTRQDIINRGTNARSKPATPAPAPARPATPAPAPARPATPAPAGTRPATPAPAGTRPATPAPASASAKPTPAAPARNGFGAPTAGMAAQGSVSSVTAPAPAPKSSGPSVSDMIAASKARQASTPSASPKPAAPGAGRDYLMKRQLNQNFDVFDVIKGHLIDEGYADTEDAALQIMANMSEEWKKSIIG